MNNCDVGLARDVVVAVYLDRHPVLLVPGLLRRTHHHHPGLLPRALQGKVQLLLVVHLGRLLAVVGLGVSQVPLQLGHDPLLFPQLLLPGLAHHDPAGDLGVELRQQTFLFPHLLLDGAGTVGQVGDDADGRDVAGQLHVGEQGGVVVEYTVEDSAVKQQSNNQYNCAVD